MKRIAFRALIVIEPDNGQYYAYCPALDGLHVGGSTEEEALRNAKDAAIAYLKSLLKHGDPIPLGIESEVETSESPSLRHSQHIHRHIEELALSAA